MYASKPLSADTKVLTFHDQENVREKMEIYSPQPEVSRRSSGPEFSHMGPTIWDSRPFTQRCHQGQTMYREFNLSYIIKFKPFLYFHLTTDLVAVN